MPWGYVQQLKDDRMAVITRRLDAKGPAILEICAEELTRRRVWFLPRFLWPPTLRLRVLASIELPRPSFIGGVHFGTVLLGPCSPYTDWMRFEFRADKTGKAVSARIKDGAGDIHLDNITVGDAGNADIIISSTSLVAGQLYLMDRFTVTHF